MKREGARYFITFRLADSLPAEAFMRIQAERAEMLTRFHVQQKTTCERNPAVTRTQNLAQIERDYFRKLEAHLDKEQGACWLRRPEIAQLTADTLRFFEGKRYLLKAWVIMPNHVHVVFWPMPNHTLSTICQSWKRHIAREANKLLNRTGQAFWQPETFDHWIRNDQEHARCCSYVIHNPVKARFCSKPEDWRWSSAWHSTTSQSTVR